MQVRSFRAIGASRRDPAVACVSTPLEQETYSFCEKSACLDPSTACVMQVLLTGSDLSGLEFLTPESSSDRTTLAWGGPL